MNKQFSIDQEELTREELFECILRGSSFAQGCSLEEYYSCAEYPDNDWWAECVEDIRGWRKFDYKGFSFFCDENQSGIPVTVFHKGDAFYFDRFYTDCPILAEILSERKTVKENTTEEEKYDVAVRAAQMLREAGFSTKEIQERFGSSQKIAGLLRAATVRGV